MNHDEVREMLINVHRAHFVGSSHEVSAEKTRKGIESAGFVIVRREAVESLRRLHRVVEGDCWYSCPASGECCRDNGSTGCDCGADRHNAIIDNIVKARDV